MNRRLVLCCFSALLCLTPGAVVAQTPVSDGIRAYLSGDATTAVRLLRPLAEGTSEPDPLAQFFMATLYESGRGVDADPFRACALYRRAATAANPLMNQSVTLGRTLEAHSPIFARMCDLDDKPLLAVTSPSISSPRVDSPIAEAIDLFSRREYARAAALLDALAIQSPRPDHAAEFLLAAMYENGLGVPTDPIRACSLYVRAEIDSPEPLRHTAAGLQHAMRSALSPDAGEDCLLYVTLGFDHRFRPEVFWLESGNSISFDLKGATIRYNGTDTRIKEYLGQPGAIFLPLHHTALAAGPAGSARRHFIEVLMWLPRKDKQEWDLIWRLFEVVRDRLETAGGARLTTFQGREPPSEPAFDIRTLVELRVNGDGNAESVVANGPDARSEVIPSEDERLAAQAASRARAAAEAKIDWTLVREMDRAPALMYSGAAGCGDLFVYGWSADRTEAISVRADKEALHLSTKPLVLDAANSTASLDIRVHVYERPVRSWRFCSDVDMGLTDETWRITRGAVTITLSPPGVVKGAPRLYRATIVITGAEFMSASGARIKLAGPLVLAAVVGTFSG